jgi:hypothetical protein
MARQKFYSQCTLRRLLRANRKREPASWLQYALGPGSTVYEMVVSWIPDDIAKKGNKVRIKESGPDEWSEGWEVMDVGSKLAGDKAEAACRDYLHQRDQSDV